MVLNALPKTALGPIFIVWMGAGTGAIIVTTLAISLIVTILNMYEGFRATDAQKIRLMAAMGASRWQLLWILILRMGVLDFHVHSPSPQPMSWGRRT